MRSQLKICLIAVFLGFLDQSASGAEAAAQNLLEQSEAALVRSRVFKITYRASQEHIASVPELGMAGVLFFQSGNRFYLTNVGSFFGVDSQVECVADGTNYLAVVSPNKIRWERNSIQPDFNKSLIRRFLLAGVTPIVASEIMTGFPLGGNPNSQPLPYLTGPFSASEAKLIGDQTVEGRASLHIEMIFSMGAGEPVKTDLWLDKNTLFPVKRVTHDKSSGDVTEMYTLVLSPAIPGDTFSPQRVIQSRKLEATIRQMEQPDALLMKACREGDVKLAAESVSKGANVNAKTTIMDSPPSFSPLLFAAQTGNLELVRLLVEHGAEINTGTLSGATPLQFACMSGKIETVNYLIEHGATLTNATASLCWAAWRGHSNTVVLLVEKGVPVDQSAGELGTPLQRALQGDFLSIASYLIQHGADINKSEHGSPLLHTAVRFGTPETVKFLLDAGAKPNERDSYGMTPLMHAASCNNPSAAELLLKHGADPQLKDSRGKTAMDMVSRHKEIITFFEQKGLIKPVQTNGRKP